MPACPNCQHNCSKDWSHCPKCGANLESKSYSKDDDPLEKLKNKVDKMDEFLTEKFPEEPNAPTPKPNDAPKPPSKRRKTLFGD